DRSAVDLNESTTNSPRAAQSDIADAAVRSAESRKYTHTDVEPSAASSSHTCRSTDATGPDTPCADTGDPTNTMPATSVADATTGNDNLNPRHRRLTSDTISPSPHPHGWISPSWLSSHADGSLPSRTITGQDADSSWTGRTGRDLHARQAVALRPHWVAAGGAARHRGRPGQGRTSTATCPQGSRGESPRARRRLRPRPGGRPGGTTPARRRPRDLAR